MSNTLIEMQARHQIHERVAQASAPRMPLPPAATGSPSGSAGSPTASTTDLADQERIATPRRQ